MGSCDRRRRLLVCGVFFCCAWMVRDTLAAPTMTPAEENALKDRLNRLVADVRDAYKVGAISLGVVLEGAPFYSTAIGCENKPYQTGPVEEYCGKNDRVTGDSIFPLASVSKTFAARLAIEAEVQSDDGGWLDIPIKTTVNNPGMGLKTRPTGRELLSHMAGIGTHTALSGMSRGEEYDVLGDEEFKEAMQHGKGAVLPSKIRNSSQPKYANLGTHLGAVMAAEMLKEKSVVKCPPTSLDKKAQCWASALEQLVFEQLGMTRTFATWRDLHDARLAAVNGYAGGLADMPAPALGVNVSRINLDNAGASGSMLSTANDLMAFLQWWITDDSLAAQRGREETDARDAYKLDFSAVQCGWVPARVSGLVRSATNSAEIPCTGKYTLGWVDQTWPWNTNLKYKWHNGQLEGAKNIIAFDATHRWGLVILTNRDTFGQAKGQDEALLQAAIGYIYEALGQNAKPNTTFRGVSLYWDYTGNTLVTPWPKSHVESILTIDQKRPWTLEKAMVGFDGVKKLLESKKPSPNPIPNQTFTGCYRNQHFGALCVKKSVRPKNCDTDTRPALLQLSATGVVLHPNVAAVLSVKMPKLIPCATSNAESMDMAYEVGRGGNEQSKPGAELHWFSGNKFSVGSPYNIFTTLDFSEDGGNVTVQLLTMGTFTAIKYADREILIKNGSTSDRPPSGFEWGWVALLLLVSPLCYWCGTRKSSKSNSFAWGTQLSETFRPVGANETLNPARLSRLNDLSGGQEGGARPAVCYIPPSLKTDSV